MKHKIQLSFDVVFKVFYSSDIKKDLFFGFSGDYDNDDVLDSFLLRAGNLGVRSRQPVLPLHNSGHNFLSTILGTMWHTGSQQRICSVSQNSVRTLLTYGWSPPTLPPPS